MAKPIINSIQAFDAQAGAQVTFSLSGGVSYGNKIWIYDAVTLDLVYEHPKKVVATSSPERFTCVIPANTLQNGKRYYAQIQCLDKNGVPGAISDKSTFYCLSIPEFKFRGVVNGQKVELSYLDVEVDYYQPNGEKLQSYRFGLYDHNKVIINESSLIYYAKNQSLSYRFKGLASGKKYYISASGVTTKGLIASTGFIEINPEYVLKKDFAQIIPENKAWGGYVSISTSIKLIGYNLNDDDYEFISGEYVNLNTNNPDKLNYILYDNGFVIEEGFTLFARHYAAKPNEPIVTISNDRQKIIISCHRIDDLYYYKLTVNDGGLKYIRYSERVPYSKTKIYTVFMRKHDDNLYEFYVYDENASGVTDDDYTFQQLNGNLQISANNRMPVYQIVDKSLITGEYDVYFDAATGMVMRMVD